MGIPRDRDVGSCLKGACINAGVKVDAIGHEKENGVCIDISGVDEAVIDSAARYCNA
jgi:hypothetical protein